MTLQLKLTDGTNTVNLASDGDYGIFYDSYEFGLPDTSRGLAMSNSPLTDGSYPLGFSYQDPVDTIRLKMAGVDQQNLFEYQTKLINILTQAVNYWRDQFGTPVWLIVQGERDEKPRYAIIKNYSYTIDTGTFDLETRANTLTGTLVVQHTIWQAEAPFAPTNVSDPERAVLFTTASRNVPDYFTGSYPSYTHVYATNTPSYPTNALTSGVLIEQNITYPSYNLIYDFTNVALYFGYLGPAPYLQAFNLAFSWASDRAEDANSSAPSYATEWRLEEWNGTAWVAASGQITSQIEIGPVHTARLGGAFSPVYLHRKDPKRIIFMDTCSGFVLASLYRPYWAVSNPLGLGSGIWFRLVQVFPFFNGCNSNILLKGGVVSMLSKSGMEIPAEVTQVTARQIVNYAEMYSYSQSIRLYSRSKSRNRGGYKRDFSPYINAAYAATTNQNVGFSTLNLTGEGNTELADARSPCGFFVNMTNPIKGDPTFQIRITSASYWPGKYRMFVRTFSGPETHLGVQIWTNNGLLTTRRETIKPISNPPAIPKTLSVTDYGIIQLPNLGFDPASSEYPFVDFRFFRYGALATAPQITDLILMPVDEWTARVFTASMYNYDQTQTFGAVLRRVIYENYELGIPYVSRLPGFPGEGAYYAGDIWDDAVLQSEDALLVLPKAVGGDDDQAIIHALCTFQYADIGDIASTDVAEYSTPYAAVHIGPLMVSQRQFTGAGR